MSILDGIRKYKQTLDDLAEKKGLCKFQLYWDCFYARIRYGCVLNHYVVGNFYKRNSFERKNIFTYKYWDKVVSTVNRQDYIHFLKEKVDFNTFFHDYIGREWLYAKNMKFEEFSSFCKQMKGGIIKPMNGLEGEGVHFETFPIVDSEIRKKYEELNGKDLLIEECIKQHTDMIFGNKSVNTIRVYTVRNDKTDEITIIKTVVRAGIGESIVDNSHSGGCAYEVDQEKGFIISSYYAANGTTSFIHPGTEICMLGRKIPYWNEVLAICEKAAKHLPECRYIGWDVAITKDGPLLIEGNHMPDLDMIEFVGSYGYKHKVLKGLGL